MPEDSDSFALLVSHPTDNLSYHTHSSLRLWPMTASFQFYSLYGLLNCRTTTTCVDLSLIVKIALVRLTSYPDLYSMWYSCATWVTGMGQSRVVVTSVVRSYGVVGELYDRNLSQSRFQRAHSGTVQDPLSFGLPPLRINAQLFCTLHEPAVFLLHIANFAHFIYDKMNTRRQSIFTAN